MAISYALLGVRKWLDRDSELWGTTRNETTFSGGCDRPLRVVTLSTWAEVPGCGGCPAHVSTSADPSRPLARKLSVNRLINVPPMGRNAKITEKTITPCRKDHSVSQVSVHKTVHTDASYVEKEIGNPGANNDGKVNETVSNGGIEPVSGNRQSRASVAHRSIS